MIPKDLELPAVELLACLSYHPGKITKNGIEILFSQTEIFKLWKTMERAQSSFLKIFKA